MSGRKILFIIVEGNDDERFVDRILKPLFQQNYDVVKVWQYAQQKDSKIENFLKSIKQMSADYVFLADINASPCITYKKEKLQKKFNYLDKDKIIVVVQEIEDWYIAGLEDEGMKFFKIPSLKNADKLNKEVFDNYYFLNKKKFTSRIDFMIEMLKYFSVDEAMRKNKSFKYFIERFK